MSAWPFAHNWQSPYRVTYSFNTTIITSQAGFEQRIANRAEPRRAIEITLLEDKKTARQVDRFIWAIDADTFTFIDPVDGSSSAVRLDDSVSYDHPTNGVVVSSVTMSVEPGTDPFTPIIPDVSYTYQGFLVFPYAVNWKDGAPDQLTLPRRTVDFGRGRIAVTRPIAFNSRATTATLVVEDDTTLVDFFSYMNGRQGEFWLPSLLDDLKVVETVSATVIRVEGTDAAAMVDTVNTGLRFDLYSGAIYFRRIVGTAVDGATTLLTLDSDVPDDLSTVQQLSWLRVARFASDDMTIEWLTNGIGQSQVQMITLPYAPSEETFGFDDDTAGVVDYYGTFSFTDPLQVLVNQLTPLASEWP